MPLSSPSTRISSTVSRSFPVGDHFGIVRLRVWPTTAEETTAALQRLLEQVGEGELRGALVIVDRSRIRVRPRRTEM